MQYLIILFLFILSGCVPIPIPTSTVMFHSRDNILPILETSYLDNYSQYLLPTFDSKGKYLAVYDWHADEIRILHKNDFSIQMSFKPKRWPKRLYFSSNGHYLIVQTDGRWIEDSIRMKNTLREHIGIDSQEATQDWIHYAQAWDLKLGQKIQEVSCEDVITTKPEGGWLWASKWVVRTGYKMSHIFDISVSEDEKELSILCQNGIVQRWDLISGMRLSDASTPPYWNEHLLFENGIRSSYDRKSFLVNIGQKHYVWEQTNNIVQYFFDDCLETFQQPYLPFSKDNRRVVLICHKGSLKLVPRVWDSYMKKEMPLTDSEFGFFEGTPQIHGDGVAISPDGKYLAVVLEAQMAAIYPSLPSAPYGSLRTDLRIWDIDSGQELVNISLDELAGISYRGVHLAFSPDGSILAVAGRKLRLYRLENFTSKIH